MATVGWEHEVYYDPLGLADNNHRATVFYRTDVTWGINGRPWLLVADGGGWSDDSGEPVETITIDDDSFIAQAYQRGFAIIVMGYTTNATPAGPETAFDYRSWTLVGNDLRLSSTPTNLAIRHSEKDAVNFIQHLRFYGIGDLDTRDGEGAAFGKSAGCVTLSFIALGPDRSDPSGTPGTRYVKNTRIKTFLSRSTISTFLGWVNSTAVQHFINDAKDGINDTVGDLLGNPAFASTGQFSARTASSLWYAKEGTAATLNATFPVWLSNASAIEWGGPYTFSGMINVLNDQHPSESTLGLKALLEGLNASFHTANSEFYPATTMTEQEIADSQFAFLIGVFGISAEVPSSEPLKKQIIDALVGALQAIDGSSPYFNTIVASNVKVTDVAPPETTTFPAIFVSPARTGYDNSRSKVVRSVAGEMQVQLTCLLRTATQVSRAIERLIHDVHSALYADHTLGGLVIDVRVTGDESLYPTDAQDPICGADIFVSIDYRALRTDLKTQAT